MRAVILIIAWWLAFGPVAQADELDPGYWARTPLPQIGLATFYAPGLMEYVADYRQRQGQLPACPECVGAVALLRGGDIGRRVWLQPSGGERVGPFLVIDCAHRDDIPPLLARNWVVDVSFEVGQMWGMDRPLDGVMVLEDPADADALSASPQVLAPLFIPRDQVVISPPTPTPATAPVRPTPWPPRAPAGSSGVEPLVSPTAVALPSGPLLPSPLTPIITTPTPRPRPTAVLPPTGAPMASSTPPDPAIGRPGQALLAEEPTPSPAAPAVSSPAASPPRPTVSPPVPVTPILPGSAPISTPAPSAEEPFLLRLWRALFGY